MAAIFVSNGTPSCLPSFFNFVPLFSITTFCLSDVCFWVEYENVVLHRLPFFRLLFTYRLIFRRIPSTFTYFYPTRKVVFICHSFNPLRNLHATVQSSTVVLEQTICFFMFCVCRGFASLLHLNSVSPSFVLRWNYGKWKLLSALGKNTWMCLEFF
jgi:hypothetical protein